jgi:hypothetical protein
VAARVRETVSARVFSVPAPNSGYPTGANPLSRKRNIINGRLEPFIQFNDKMNIKLGASLMNFTADFGPTLKQENVIRYAGDLTVNLNYVAFWGDMDLKYPVPAMSGLTDAQIPRVTVSEIVHTPGLTVAVLPQLTLMAEVPVHKRFVPAALMNPKAEYILDKAVVVTPHARI